MNRFPPQYGCLEFAKAGRIHRRQLLQIGAMSALGLSGLAERLALAQSQQVKPRAKACILLFMWGGPSQLDTFDLKPNAPAEIRGQFNPIATKVPGLQICEHFTQLAGVTDKLSIIRSLCHDDPAHLSSGHATLTGQRAPVVKSDADPPSAKDSPHVGSLLARLKPNDSGMPPFVSMPWKAYHPAAPGGEAPGQHGGWLGAAYDSMLLTGDLNHPDWRPQGLGLPADITFDRLSSRVELLRVLDAQRGALEQAAEASAYHHHQRRALGWVGSDKVRQAFDLNGESAATRERYGRNIHGQCVLMARRLVEHGVPLVSVNWHNDGRNFWDTHGNNFNRLKNDLIPPADRALAALLMDLEERGMLDETLVAWVGEFGRRPQITANNAGREHWPFCYSGILAGGGIRRGFVYGSSDARGAYPATDPVSPQDFTTTMLHALGIAADEVLTDRDGRIQRIASGKVISELFA